MPSYFVHPVSRQAIATKNLAAGVAGQLCLLNGLNLVASTAPTTVLLPPTAGDGECVYVEDLSDLAGTNNITIDGNGDTIDGAATLLLDSNGEVAALVFDDGEWKRVTPVRLFESSANPVPFARTTDLAGAVTTSPGGADQSMQFRNGAAFGGHPTLLRSGNGLTSLAAFFFELGIEGVFASSAGYFRFGNNVAETLAAWRRADNLGNHVILAKSAAGDLYIGRTAGAGSYVDNIVIDAASGITLANFNSTMAIINAAGSYFSALVRLENNIPLQFGTTNPAATGIERTRNVHTKKARDSANANDLYVYESTASDYIIFGSPLALTAAQQFARVYLYGNAQVELGVGTAGYAILAGGEIQAVLPIVGASGSNSPFSVHGRVAHTFAADANYTVTAAQYKYDWLRFNNGSWTAPRTVTFPHPSSEARGYYKTVHNNTAHDMTVSTGTGVTVTIATVTARRLFFDPDGVSFAGASFTIA